MKKYKLGDILELQRGYDLPHSEMEEGNVPVAGSSGIIGYHSISKIDPPCITIGRSGSVGKLFFYNEAIWPHNTSLYIKSFKNNNEKYIFYLLKTVDFERLCDSSVVPSLNRNFVYPIKVPFYDNIADQQKIAAVLSSLDDKIALNNRINAKLEQMAKRLYDYWFVQFDFPNADDKPYKSTGGKMVWNEELKREIPEGWEVGILSDIANITMGQSPEGSSYNEDGKGTIFYQGSTDFGIRFPTVRMYTTEPTRFAKKGDILMSVRAPVGAVNIANTDCCIGRGLAALNSKIGSITYLWYLMDVFKHTFENKNAAGTTFGSITKDELFNLPVVIPSNDVILAFNKKTLSIFNYQLSIEKETQKLTALRDRLLPLLMNGQVNVI